MIEPDRADSDLKPSSLSGLPVYPGNPFLISEIACQECEEIRPGVKSYEVIHFACMVFFTACRIDTHVKCPICMRDFLLRRILPALLFANILSPIILVWWSVLFLRTFFR
ncbi:MAG TPA: hypothetical protein VH592_22725 [Gemmataceae bacterium]|jgi:hypothetical protein